MGLRGIISGLASDPPRKLSGRVATFNNAGTAIRLPAIDYEMAFLTLNANCTVTLPKPVLGQSVDICVMQGGAGFFDVTWASSGTIHWLFGKAPFILHRVGDTSVVRFSCYKAGVWEAVPVGFDGYGTVLPFSLGDGTLVSGVTKQRFRPEYLGIEVLGASAATDFANGPTGGTSTILDLVTTDPPVSMWPTNTGNRPTILSGNQETLALTVPDTRYVDAGTSIRASVVQTGSGTPGYVVLHMIYRWASA